MRLKIKLLSDLCTYSGEIYNSLADIDVVYDKYGLPYIPAKRIKGCIRESFLELVNFGIYPVEMYNKIFGNEGDLSAAFSIGNAYLDSYDDICSDLENCEDRGLVHAQNVLKLYTYIRTQTSIDYETGTAAKGSLRNIRVVKKDTEFYADINFNRDKNGKTLSDAEADALFNAAEMVTHMGVRRSRGLGLVKISRDTDFIEQNNKKQINGLNNNNRYRIDYRIYLKSAMLCKSQEGNQTRCNNYIEGSKVLGLIAGSMENSEFIKIMNNQSGDNELIVSNAYIEENGKRCIPVRASIQKKKDQGFGEDNLMKVYDMLNDDIKNDIKSKAQNGNDAIQLSPIGIEYMTTDGVIKGIETEIDYHHKRPNDKSIGHANGNDESSFYQLESISRGQAFRGYILADGSQSKAILDAINSNNNIRMGNSRNAEYGNIEFTIENIEEVKGIKDSKILNDFAICMDSPVILFNENGMLTSDVAVFRDYLAEQLGSEDISISECYIRYEVVGGYNVTWRKQKPVFTTLGKGTVCKFHSDKGVDISALNNYFIGERVNEGYGEIHVLSEMPSYVTLRKAIKTTSYKKETKTEIIDSLKLQEAKNRLCYEARERADKRIDKFKDDESNAIIGRLILVSKEQHSIDDMRNQVDTWSSKTRRDKAMKIVSDIEEVINQENACNTEEAYKIVAKEYLTRMKYQHRVSSKGVEKDEQ